MDVAYLQRVMRQRFAKIPLPMLLTLACLVLWAPGGGVSGAAWAQVPPGTPAVVDTSGITFDTNASTTELLESAREMFIADNYPLSEMLYKSVLIREPNNLSAMLELAVLYEATGQLQYARGLLTRALILSPSDRDIIERNNRIVKVLAASVEKEVDSLFRSGSWELALPKLSLLLTTQPENAELHYKKALCHLKLQHPEAAVEELEKAISLNHSDERFYSLRAEARRIIARRDVDKLTLRAKGAMQRHTEQGDATALEMIGKILEINPDNEWAKKTFLILTGEDTRKKPTTVTHALSERVVDGWKVVSHWVIMLTYGLQDKLEVMLFVLLALLVFNSPVTWAMVRGFSPRLALSGRLRDFSIKEILSLINTHHLTGVLNVKAGDRKGRVYFDRGEVYHCRSRGEEGREALQHLLRNSLSGHFTFREGVRTSEGTIETPLSLILLDLPERQDQITAQSVLQKQTRMKALLGKKKEPTLK